MTQGSEPRTVEAFFRFLLKRNCKKCAQDSPVIVNSSGFYSHSEEGNYCQNHQLYKAWEDFNDAGE